MKDKSMRSNTFLSITLIGWYLVFVIAVIITTIVIYLTYYNEDTSVLYKGSTNIILPRGHKLINASWKDEKLWYLIEPVDNYYTPKTKIFKEYSKLDDTENTVIFIERR